MKLTDLRRGEAEVRRDRAQHEAKDEKVEAVQAVPTAEPISALRAS